MNRFGDGRPARDDRRGALAMAGRTVVLLEANDPVPVRGAAREGIVRGDGARALARRVLADHVRKRNVVVQGRRGRERDRDENPARNEPE